LVFLVVLISAVALVAHVRNSSKNRTASQDQLEIYTGKIRSILAKITPTATEMAGAPTSNSDPAAVTALTKSTTNWAKTWEATVTELQQIPPAPGATTASQLFTESVQLYSTTVQTFKVVPDIAASQQDALLGTAQAQLSEAGQLWTTGVAVLDQARDDVGLKASGLRSPQTAVPNSSTPAPLASFSVPSGGGKGSGGNSGGSQKKSGNKGH
jgi:hypothetical protein